MDFFLFRKYFVMKKIARSKGIEVLEEPKRVIIRKGNRQIILSREQGLFGFDVIPMFDNYMKDYLPEKNNGFLEIDFSQPKKHFLNFLNASLWIPSWTEGSWPLKGYLEKYMPQEGDIVFDCGAFCGITTFALSKLVGKTGKVYAFEPDDLNYELLVKNIEENNLRNVIAVKKGIWSHKDTFLFANSGGAGSALAQNAKGDPLQESQFNNKDGEYKNVNLIEVISIQDACKLFNISNPNFVKMDIEGAEIEAISGAREFLRDKNVHFAIASYHKVNNIPTCQTLEKMFAEIGYQFETGNPQHQTTWAWKSDV